MDSGFLDVRKDAQLAGPPRTSNAVRRSYYHMFCSFGIMIGWVFCQRNKRIIRFFWGWSSTTIMCRNSGVLVPVSLFFLNSTCVHFRFAKDHEPGSWQNLERKPCVWGTRMSSRVLLSYYLLRCLNTNTLSQLFQFIILIILFAANLSEFWADFWTTIF